MSENVWSLWRNHHDYPNTKWVSFRFLEHFGFLQPVSTTPRLIAALWHPIATTRLITTWWLPSAQKLVVDAEWQPLLHLVSPLKRLSDSPFSACFDNSSANCSSMAPYCNNPTYYSLMTSQCPQTCGRCEGGMYFFLLFTTLNYQVAPIIQLRIALPCLPNVMTPPTTILWRNSVLKHVAGVDWRQLLLRVCSFLIKNATLSACYDNSSANCSQMASKCNDATYYNLMTSQCPQTCGRCGLTTTATPSKFMEKKMYRIPSNNTFARTSRTKFHSSGSS